MDAPMMPVNAASSIAIVMQLAITGGADVAHRLFMFTRNTVAIQSR